MQNLLDLAPIIGPVNTLLIFIVGYLLQSKARKIQSLLAWNSYREPIRAFANEAIDVLSRVEGLCEINPAIKKQEFWDSYNECITALSSLRDKGKLLLPNHYAELYGEDKSPAYQGIRQAALDCLKAGYGVAISINYKEAANNKDRAILDETGLAERPQLEKIREALAHLPDQRRITPEGYKGKGWSCKSAIVEVKRQFVSESQKLIDPALWTDQVGSAPKRR